MNGLDYIRARYLDKHYLGGVKVMMFCPSCHQRLYPWRFAEKYETLEEHVSDPNQDTPHKPIFKCTTLGCKLFFDTGAFFGYEGSLYSYPLIHDEDLQHALGSISYIVHKEIEEDKKRNLAKKEA